jgi:hypothetical protein
MKYFGRENEYLFKGGTKHHGRNFVSTKIRDVSWHRSIIRRKKLIENKGKYQNLVFQRDRDAKALDE